jgi:hypothetical protein
MSNIRALHEKLGYLAGSFRRQQKHDIRDM